MSKQQTQKRRRVSHIETDLPCPSINPVDPSFRGGEICNYKRNKVLQIARETTPNNAINTIHYHDLEIIHIDSWRIVSDEKRDRHGNMPHSITMPHPLCAHNYGKVGAPYLQKTLASRPRAPIQHLCLPLSVHAVRSASSSAELSLEEN